MELIASEAREKIRKRWPKSVCIKTRDGFAVYTRRYGNKLSVAPTRGEAWRRAVNLKEFIK